MVREVAESAPGRYVPYGRESYYLPDELPPEIELDFDAEFQETLQDAIYQLGRLQGIGDETSVSPIVYTSLVRREAVESVLVEGADLEFEDVFRPDDIDRDVITKDVREALNYERAIREGTDRVAETGEISLELLKELHGILLEDTRDDGGRPGEFRKHPVHIPPPEAFERPFVPPAPDTVIPLMQNLERYANRGGEYHDFIDLAIVHYQFETIHPFGDGNGRLGRVLITLQLVEQGDLTKPFLYRSAYFNEHKIEYVKHLGVKWFENRRFSSSRESVALSNDPEASCFYDALYRFHEGIHRERSLRRRGFGVSQSYSVVTAKRLTALVFGH